MTELASLRQAIDRLSDTAERGFRITWLLMLGNALVLAALMAKGFGWL